LTHTVDGFSGDDVIDRL